MRAQIILLVCLFSSFYSLSNADQSNEDLTTITYDNLAYNEWTDHVQAFKHFFQLYHVNSFLELGLGRSTKYFLDNCDFVTSVELVISSTRFTADIWYNKMFRMLSSQYQNWTPLIYLFPITVDTANSFAVHGCNIEPIDARYIEDIQKMTDQLCLRDTFDVVFIDPAIHLQGDLVNSFFNKIDIIIAHDTNFNSQIYGWHKINPPSDYETVHFNYGSGTTFWIKNDKKELIQSLKIAFKKYN
jgi:hypothetical protein